jgi:hypothetical protein
MRTPSKLFATAVLALLVSCDGTDVTKISENMSRTQAEEKPEHRRIHVDKVLGVSRSINNNGKAAVTMMIGPNDFNYFSIMMDRSSAKGGVALKEVRGNLINLTLRAKWQGTPFEESTIHPTYANVEVLSVSDTAAVIKVSAKLVSVATGRYLTLMPSTIKLEGDPLKQFMALE